MSDTSTATEAAPPEVAFYYPGAFWESSDWIKNLILFFDGVGLLVPRYMKERPSMLDPVTTSALQEHGLLHLFEPESMIDQQATEQLADAMTTAIASGVLDDLPKAVQYEALSYSRLGVQADRALAGMVLEELESRGLVRESEDGVSVPMHPMVRALVLVLLAQILRPQGSALGLDLSPATDRIQMVATLQRLLAIPDSPSAGQVVTFDLSTVGVDLGAVPIDEILDFRRNHLTEHRTYVRSVRRFTRELSLMPEPERAEAFEDRQEELDELAHDVKRTSRKAWKQPATFGLTIAGAAWTLTTGDVIGGLLAGGGGLLGGIASPKSETGAYSYLFRAHRRYR